MHGLGNIKDDIRTWACLQEEMKGAELYSKQNVHHTLWKETSLKNVLVISGP